MWCVPNLSYGQGKTNLIDKKKQLEYLHITNKLIINIITDYVLQFLNPIIIISSDIIEKKTLPHKVTLIVIISVKFL